MCVCVCVRLYVHLSRCTLRLCVCVCVTLRCLVCWLSFRAAAQTQRLDDGQDHFVLRKRLKLALKWIAIEGLEQKIFSEFSDCWSFGVLMWEIFTCVPIPACIFFFHSQPRVCVNVCVCV